MTQDQQRMQQLLGDATVFTRNKLNAGVQATGAVLSRWVGVWGANILIILILLHVLLFLNIALGFALGGLFGGSPAMGFLLLSGIYLLITLIAFAVKGVISRFIRNSMASSFIKVDDKLNEELDATPWLRIDSRYTRRPKVTDQIGAYEALVKAHAESSIVADQALDYLEQDINYFRDNYKSIVARETMTKVSQSLPFGSVLAPIVGWLGNKLIGSWSRSGKGGSKRGKTATIPTSRAGKLVQKAGPYLSVAYDIARPVLVGYLTSSLQGWLGSLWGKKKKR